MVRRELLSAGLDLMFTKELLEKSFRADGILYSASELTAPFLDYLESEYAQAVRGSAAWLADRFELLSDTALADYMIENLGRWGAEFYLKAQSREAGA